VRGSKEGDPGHEFVGIVLETYPTFELEVKMGKLHINNMRFVVASLTFKARYSAPCSLQLEREYRRYANSEEILNQDRASE